MLMKVTVSSTGLEKGKLACDTLYSGQRVFSLSDLPNCCVVQVNTDDAKLPSLLPVGRHPVAFRHVRMGEVAPDHLLPENKSDLPGDICTSRSETESI